MATEPNKKSPKNCRLPGRWWGKSPHAVVYEHLRLPSRCACGASVQQTRDFEEGIKR